MMRDLRDFLMDGLRGFTIPAAVKNKIRLFYDPFEMRGAKWIAEDPHRNEPPEWTSPSSKYVLGIIREFWHLHWPYLAACRELGVSYRLLDLAGSDWMKILEDNPCDAYIARPSVQLSTWKTMYDERLRFLAEKAFLFPDYESLYIWESKRRTHYWLRSHDIACPQTWVFYRRDEALEFASRCQLPIVYKSDSGSGSSGVVIFRDRRHLGSHIQRCFKKGFTTYRKAAWDRETGFVILQQFLPDIREWRIVRIGDSFFGYEKIRKGDFHSGSHQFGYGKPPEDALNFARLITESGRFRSMDIDIFICPDGRLMANELQAVFGQAGSREICRIGDQTGRMLYDQTSGTWRFDPGIFCRNYLCNLRIDYVLKRLDAMKETKDGSD